MRSDPAIRRHWTLVCCAFSFCWQVATDLVDLASPPVTVVVSDDPAGTTPGSGSDAGGAPGPRHPHLPSSKHCSTPSPRATHSRSMTPLESEPQQRTASGRSRRTAAARTASMPDLPQLLDPAVDCEPKPCNTRSGQGAPHENLVRQSSPRQARESRRHCGWC